MKKHLLLLLTLFVGLLPLSAADVVDDLTPKNLGYTKATSGYSAFSWDSKTNSGNAIKSTAEYKINQGLINNTSGTFSIQMNSSKSSVLYLSKSGGTITSLDITYTKGAFIVYSASEASSTVPSASDGTSLKSITGGKSGSLSLTSTDLNGAKAFFIIASGACNITEIKVTWSDEVTPPVAQDFSFGYSEKTLKVGDTFNLFDGIAEHPSDIIFTSDDENIVTVSDDGLLTAKAAGHTTVKVSWNLEEGKWTAGETGITVYVVKHDYAPNFEDMYMTVGDETDLTVPTGDCPDMFDFTVEPASDCISIVEENGEFILKALSAGVATVKVKWVDSKNIYEDGSTTFTVTVNEKPEPAEYQYPINDMTLVEGKEAVLTPEGDHPALTFAFAENAATDVVSILDNEGIVSIKALKVGETSITVTWPASDAYKAGSATIPVNVTEKPDIEERTATFVFTTDGAYGMTTLADPSKDYETNISHIESDDVALDFTAGRFRLWSATKGIELRTYDDTKISFSVPEGCSLEKICFTQGNASKIVMTADDESTLDKKTVEKVLSVTWTATTEGTREAAFSFTGSSQISTIDVTYLISEKDLHVPASMPMFEGFNWQTYKDGDVINIVPNHRTHTLYWKVEPVNAAEASLLAVNADGWNVELEGQKGSHTVKLIEGGYNLIAKAVDRKNGESPEHILTIRENGSSMTGVEAVEADGNDTPVYYNLQGVRLSEPLAPGIYIVVRGAKATKEYVR